VFGNLVRKGSEKKRKENGGDDRDRGGEWAALCRKGGVGNKWLLRDEKGGGKKELKKGTSSSPLGGRFQYWNGPQKRKPACVENTRDTCSHRSRKRQRKGNLRLRRSGGGGEEKSRPLLGVPIS